LAWLAANALYWAAADRQGFDDLLVRTHARWDSGNYLNIAMHGYTLAHCVPRPTSPFTSADWCGTVGWFPLYPLGMRLLHGLGLSHPRAGLLLAELSALGSLGLLWWLLEASPCPANLACLALAAVFPGSVYEHALFRCRWPSPAAWRSWPWRPAAAGPPPGRLLVDRGQVRDRLARPGRHLPQERRPPGPSAWRLWQVTGRPDRPPATSSGWSPSSPSWVWPRPSLLASAPRLT
jgi:hypothetical protein